MSSNLDCAFYTSFYSDVSYLKDTIDINEHYLKVGNPQGRVANETELHDLVATLTHFDDNTYTSANLCGDLMKNLKDKWTDKTTKKQWIQHYYDENNGNLKNMNRLRVINNNDLKRISNLWDNIYNKIFDIVNFNFLFYKTFYTIPSNITNLRDLQLQWLKNGVFMGQMPNLRSLNEKDNIIGKIQILLIESFNLDMSFIASYKNDMMNYMKHNSIPMLEIADENTFLLYLFLNTGYKLRLFFNENERAKYVEDRQKQYNDAIENVKNGTYKKMIDANNKLYDSESIVLMKASHKNAKEIIPIVPNNFNDIISVQNIIKHSNTLVVDCFMKLYNKDNLTEVVMTMVMNELKNCLEPVINSMELKIFVTSIVYNVFIKDKTSSLLYKGLVKEKSVEILNAIFKEYGIEDSDSLAALEQDVTFLMDNKKIVKLSYLSNVVTKLFIEAFLLAL